MNAQDTVDTVNRMTADGIDFLDASCMAIGWAIAEHVLGPENGEWSFEHDDLEMEIQKIIRAVFNNCNDEG